MKVIRTAVIGLGRIGWQRHVPQAVEHDGFELAAVVDPLQERLDEAKAAYGVVGYLDCESMLAAVKPGLVVVASPTPFHADQTIAAFESGCDVLCEKPIAASLAETDRMINSMKANGRKLMVYQPHRADRICVSLREILKRDLIGPVYMIKCAWARWRRRNDWQAFRKYGGGMLNNYGAHVIDLLLHLTGSRVRRLACRLRTVASLGDADDVVKAVIETENGVILDMDINQAAAWPVPQWHVLGRRGGIILDEEGKTWKVRYHLPGELPDLAVQKGLAAEGRIYKMGDVVPWHEETFALSSFEPIDFYQKCYDHFALGAEPFVPVAETRELMRVLEQCHQNAGLGSG